jgi:Protein of unknown function (DUF1360)
MAIQVQNKGLLFPMLQQIVVVALVAVGLSYAQAKLDGPFGLSLRLRAWAEGRSQPSWVKEGLECPYCLAFWFTLFATLLFLPLPILAFITIWLAAYGLACFLMLYIGV